MAGVKVDLALRSLSLRHLFAGAPGFGPIQFIDLAESLGFTGISLAVDGAGYRHLGGTEPWRMDQMRARLARSAMSLAIETDGTHPGHLRTMIDVAVRMGAGSLRFHSRHSGTIRDRMKRTVAELLESTPYAADRNVMLAIESYGDFTGPELAAIVEAVDHAQLKIHFDYGNSQVVLEDPIAALVATLPRIHGANISDHVLIEAPHAAGRLTVAGVPTGEGFLPIRELTRRLLDHGLRSLTFDSAWSRSAAAAAGREPLATVRLGHGSFRFLAPPFDPARVVLDPARHGGEELVRLERAALDRGLAWFRREISPLWEADIGINPG